MGTVALATAAAALAGCTSGGGSDTAGGGPRARQQAAAPGPLWNTRPRSIASLGDSITRGFDACSLLSDCPGASWSTGTEVDSLVRRLLPARTPSDGHSWNFAKTGAVMADLPGQVKTAAARRPELVTVLIGANDACADSVAQMTPAADYRRDFTAAMTALRRTLPRTQVYVASVPDLTRLWSEGRKNPWGRAVWKLGICPSMLKDPDSMDAAAVRRRAEVARRVDAYNTALKDVCGRDALCRYDGAVHAYRFTADDLSKWDWFHPGKEGQKRLATLAYREITRKEPAR
ncbi:GDSL-type esterase/lipase family protein [Streptomyces sp. B1866]|uniref:GDSL-type esterase/lipase family protein n=1 Tax=Streptomyces sp. B1866 TaxID=3075431 RepID=UPI002890152C|nr:GDSL-type esterase/lipase family protein [Streptomyces sp. B1866]MDT3398321.1 GDSL-type esterase/lipase family protein [Streptomyces sp. B1866]